MIVVDASLFVAWLLDEPLGKAEQQVWDILATKTALVPTHWPNEIANALRRAVRTKRLPLHDLKPTVHELAAFDVRLSSPPIIADVETLVGDALRFDLSVYDLQYIRLAQSHQLPLATMDAAMRSAAQRLNIALLPE